MKQITCPHCGDTYPDFDVAHVCSKGPYAPRLKPKMNERIKELAIEAGYDWAWDTQIDFGHKEMEKFAELIVRECALVVHKKTGPKSALNVLEHFGVEE
jgi:hypothetical protein